MIAAVFFFVSFIYEEILTPEWLKEARDIAREVVDAFEQI